MWEPSLNPREHTLQVAENKVFRKISEPHTDQISEQFRVLRNEELRGLHILYLLWFRKWTLRWTRHESRMGETRDVYRISERKPLRTPNFGRDWMTILKQISGRWVVKMRREWNWLRIVSNDGSSYLAMFNLQDLLNVLPQWWSINLWKSNWLNAVQSFLLLKWYSASRQGLHLILS